MSSRSPAQRTDCTNCNNRFSHSPTSDRPAKSPCRGQVEAEDLAAAQGPAQPLWLLVTAVPQIMTILGTGCPTVKSLAQH